MSTETVSTITGWQDMANLPVRQSHLEHSALPRRNEFPQNVTFRGFTEAQQVETVTMLQRLGLPLNRVKEITHEETKNGDESVLASAWIEEGKLNFYKSWDNLPENALGSSKLGTAAHELTHINSPFYAVNKEAYGTEKNRRQAAENAILVAIQTDARHKFLNGYHKLLYKRAVAGQIDQQRFIEETNAIMMELRITNPKHLEEVLRSQNPETVDQIMAQTDKTLMQLMGFEQPEQLNAHLESLKAAYRPQKS